MQASWINGYISLLTIYIRILTKKQSYDRELGFQWAQIVLFSNLFCFAYEYDFIVQLVNANRVDLVYSFSGTARYIDDLFCIDDNLFSNYLYVSQIDDQGLHGIYPDFLTLNCEQESREHVSFLDVLIFRDGNIWCTKTFDKTEHHFRVLNRRSIHIHLLFWQ